MRRCRGWMIAGGSIEILKNRIAEQRLRPPLRPDAAARPTRRSDAHDLCAQALLSPRSGRARRAVGRRRQDRRPAAAVSARSAGYSGRIYPINPRRDTVLGERAWPSLAALPEVPDHAYILTPDRGARSTRSSECGRIGVPVVTILADGFAEAGRAGRGTRRRACARSARAPGVRIVGPSSLGVVNLREQG